MPINSFDNYPMSWKPTLPKTNQPIYQALAAQLETDIKNGTLQPGIMLPLNVNLQIISILILVQYREPSSCVNKRDYYLLRSDEVPLFLPGLEVIPSCLMVSMI